VTRGTVIALLGAESTGKTSLANALAQRWRDAGRRVALVPEHLREWCDTAGRTPRQGEQAGIAAEQQRRIEAAAATHDWVLADTTALMTAVYHRQVFGDDTLFAQALAWQRGVHATLLTALDLPWVADPQRDGPHVRVPVDRLLREALMGAGLPFVVVSGTGPARVEAAERAVASALRAREAARRPEADAPPGTGRWKHWCARCGDPDCERHLFDRRG
jgi:nicotinamide riboside kinase